VDNAWEQEKLEVRKMLENAAESHTSGAPEQEKKIPVRGQKQWTYPKYSAKRQARKPLS
jgi:hypothetical protein